MKESLIDLKFSVDTMSWSGKLNESGIGYIYARLLSIAKEKEFGIGIDKENYVTLYIDQEVINTELNLDDVLRDFVSQYGDKEKLLDMVEQEIELFFEKLSLAIRPFL